MLELKTKFARPPAFGPTAISSDTRILIFDDDRQVGMALNLMLAARGFGEVRAVRSAPRALAVAEQFLPDIVFLQLDLPDAGNLALALQLRRNSRLRGVRLIALTHDAEHSGREDARAAGFERFLTKPVMHEELEKILGTAGPPAH